MRCLLPVILVMKLPLCKKETSMYIVMFAIFSLMLHDEKPALFTYLNWLTATKQWRGNFSFLGIFSKLATQSRCFLAYHGEVKALVKAEQTITRICNFRQSSNIFPHATPDFNSPSVLLLSLVASKQWKFVCFKIGRKSDPNDNDYQTCFAQFSLAFVRNLAAHFAPRLKMFFPH